jgi:hypothetical protein
MNIQRDIVKNLHSQGKSIEEKHSTSHSFKQYVIANRLCSKEEKKMKVTKTLTSIVGICLIPIAGLVFMQKADAYKKRVMGMPYKAAPGKCTSVIKVSSSGRDSWYWAVECGRNHSRKDYLKARQACFYDYNNRGDLHQKHFSDLRGPLIQPYAHNKCY